MKDILEQVNHQREALQNQLDGLSFDPDFTSLQSLITGYTEHLGSYKVIDQNIAILEEIRPILEEAIAKNEQAKAKEKRLDELSDIEIEIKKLIGEIDTMKPGPEQSLNLLKVSNLIERKEALKNG